MCSLVHKGSWDILLFKTHSDLSSGLIKLSCVHVHDAYVHRILWLCPNLLRSWSHLMFCAYTSCMKLGLYLLSMCHLYKAVTLIIIAFQCSSYFSVSLYVLLLRMTQNDCCAWSQLHMCVCVCVCVCVYAQSTLKSIASLQAIMTHYMHLACSQLIMAQQK